MGRYESIEMAGSHGSTTNEVRVQHPVDFGAIFAAGSARIVQRPGERRPAHAHETDVGSCVCFGSADGVASTGTRALTAWREVLDRGVLDPGQPKGAFECRGANPDRSSCRA